MKNLKKYFSHGRSKANTEANCEFKIGDNLIKSIAKKHCNITITNGACASDGDTLYQSSKNRHNDK